MDFTFKPRKATNTFVVNKNIYKRIKSIFQDNQVVFGTTRFSQYEFQNGIACDNPGCFCYNSEIKSVCVNCFMLITECKCTDEFQDSLYVDYNEGDECPRCSQKTLVNPRYLKELIETEYYKQTCDFQPPKNTEISYSDICDYRWCEECKIEIAEDVCRLCNTELCSLCMEIYDNICSDHDHIKCTTFGFGVRTYLIK